LDNYRIEKRSREGYPKNDWEDDLGCERTSRIFGKEIIGERALREEKTARVRKLFFVQ
jgi:hypothetical protein